MRHCLTLTLVLTLAAPAALAAQRAANVRSAVSRLPTAHPELELSTALAQQRVAQRQPACSRSFVTNMAVDAAGGALGAVIMLPLYGLIRVAHKGVLPQVRPAVAAASGAAAWSVLGIRETIRCRRQTARRR